MNKLKICVLLGGISSERNISLVTGYGILQNLDKEKYEVCGMDPIDFRSEEDRKKIIENTPLLPYHKTIIDELYRSDYLINANSLFGENPYRPDLFYIALHGKGGEDGAIQGFLQTLNIRYTGCGILASALATNKIYAKRAFMTAGIKVPKSVDINTNLGYDINRIKKEITEYPVFVKANNQGSSIGLRKIFSPDELEKTIEELKSYDNLITIEEAVEGTEITVPVIGRDTPLPPIEIIPKNSDGYDLKNKYTPGSTDEICPARISPILTKKAQLTAVLCHKTLNCRSISRTDMIIDGNRDIYVLETNTIPGMTPTSLVPQSAKVFGLSYSELLDVIIKSALK